MLNNLVRSEMGNIPNHPLSRARIAANGACSLTATLFPESDLVVAQASRGRNCVSPLRMFMHATFRLIDSWSGDTLDSLERDTILDALDTLNRRGWIRAGAGELSLYYLLADALDTEIGERYLQDRAQNNQLAALGNTVVAISVTAEVMHRAVALTNGDPLLAAHLLIGAAHMALRDAS